MVFGGCGHHVPCCVIVINPHVQTIYLYNYKRTKVPWSYCNNWLTREILQTLKLQNNLSPSESLVSWFKTIFIRLLVLNRNIKYWQQIWNPPPFLIFLDQFNQVNNKEQQRTLNVEYLNHWTDWTSVLFISSYAHFNTVHHKINNTDLIQKSQLQLTKSKQHGYSLVVKSLPVLFLFTSGWVVPLFREVTDVLVLWPSLTPESPFSLVSLLSVSAGAPSSSSFGDAL